MKQPHYTVEQRFVTDSQTERKKLIQQKMENYLQRALQNSEDHGGHTETPTW